MTRRVVVVTEEPLAERLAGPAIRALELSRALAGSGECTVDLVSLTGCSRADEQVALHRAGEPALRALVRSADVVLVQGDVLGLQPWLAGADPPLVGDGYDPVHLEQLEQARSLGETRWLAAAEIGVTTHLAHVETEFSFRTRVLDYLWAGLPVVSTAGDALADLVAARGLGAVVPPGDVDALTAALDGLLADPARRAAAAAASARAADAYRWPIVVRPLLDFCRAPRRAPDLVLPPADRALLGVSTLNGRPPLRTRLAAARREGGLPLLARRAGARLLPGRRR